jgi:Tfp pilus assembly protein PilF
VVEKLPLFALSVIFSVIAFVVQQKGGAMTTMESFPLEYRILNSINSYVEYIRKLILPDDLAFFYPQAYVSLWRAALCGLFMAAVTAAVFLSCGARKRKYLLTGWLWYVVTLIPVIGIVQIGSQAMADRYAYVTTIGLFIMIVWGAADLAAGKPGRKIVALLSLSVLIISFTAYTRTQVRYWKNYMTLCSHAVKVTEGVYVAYLGMGDYMFRAGKYEEALVFFTEALKINTKNAQTRRCVGKTLLRLNRPGEAVYHLSASINLEKNKPDAETYDAMGIALVELGKPHMAIDFYKRAIELMPDNPSAYNNLGIAYLRMNDPVNSEIYFSKALAIRHDFRAALENLQMVRKNMAGKSRGEASGRPDGRRSDALR